MKGRYLIILLAALLAVSCEGLFCPDKKNTFDRVMILYSAGCNSLNSSLLENIEELKSGYIPGKKDNKALVVISHAAAGYLKYEPNTNPYIIRLYRDKKKGVVADTIKTVEAGKFLTQPSVMKEVLGYVKDNFKSEHYGMVFSSHATGWVPEGYYNNPKSKSSGGSDATWLAPRREIPLPEGAVLYYEPEQDEGAPLVKSIGEEDTKYEGTKISYELSLSDFASSIPMHLDYLIFDACLMGCVEVAYELRGVCDKMAFSPAEILEYGFRYETIASQLLEGNADVYSACRDYFDKYDKQTDQYLRSATITLVDCTKMDRLASICKDLVSAYRIDLAGVNPSSVQPYFRSYHHWFYDLEDIFVKAGISDTEKNNLKNAIDACILYKAATPTFLLYKAGGGSGFKIETYSGFSMYLPCNGNDYLDNYYKSFAWNKAIGLVQ